MVVLGGGAVSYERGTPVGVGLEDGLLRRALPRSKEMRGGKHAYPRQDSGLGVAIFRFMPYAKARIDSGSI